MTDHPIPILEQLPLWRHFESRASHDQIGVVGNLIRIATDVLRVIRDTFPTYTLHDREHADNVVILMGELLGTFLGQLSPLEAAMLILSAYLHDAGMAYSEKERTSLKTDEYFPQFLDDNPNALLLVENANTDEVPQEIAEWYCRWRHADRVFHVLDQIRTHDPNALRWGTHDLREPLGDLCRSHNLDARILMDDVRFPTSFRAECDLRFCAIILRLADIMDFDRSRSPEQLYRDLGLAERLDKPGRTSDLEWRKHLSSEGFKFPRERASGYTVDFIAGPDDPAVEYDIRQFLDTIEVELAKCTSVQRSCSHRLRDCPLPARIDRNNIKGNGYTYGEHRFTLDKDQVLNLLMGENLYDDRYVFVRELLQNSLDASRHREFHERAAGDAAYTCPPIEVSTWKDEDGYRWVRFDDYGMGMTERIINNYLLKVGQSYYQSPQFEADLLRFTKRTAKTFKPVSRFGIGLLSCFIVGDRLEVATRHAATADGPLRLSMRGLRNFFVLQKRPNLFLPMPSPAGAEEGERKSSGTTVCVRLNPKTERTGFDLRRALESHLFCPPVPVLLDKRAIGLEPEKVFENAWCEVTTITVSALELRRIGRVLRHEFVSGLEIDILPIDLTHHSPTGDLRGQMVLARLKPSDELKHALRTRKVDYRGKSYEQQMALSIRFVRNEIALELKATRQLEKDGVERGEAKTVALRIGLSKYLTVAPEVWEQSAPPWGYPSTERNGALIAHNGMRLPSQPHNLLSQSQFLTSHDSACLGVLMLYDSLRPDLSLARDEITRISWAIHSCCTLAARRALSKVTEQADVPLRSLFGRTLGTDEEESPSFAEALADPNLKGNQFWPSEKLFPWNSPQLSVCDLKSDLGLSIEFTPRMPVYSSPSWTRDIPHGGFAREMAKALARKSLRVTFRFDAPNRFKVIADGRSPLPISDAERMFSPFFFAHYDGEHGGVLQTPLYTPLRRDHPFSEWLLRNSTHLYDRFAGILSEIRQTLWSSDLFFEKMAYKEAVDRVRTINDALRRITEVEPGIGAQNVFLTVRDFGFAEPT